MDGEEMTDDVSKGLELMGQLDNAKTQGEKLSVIEAMQEHLQGMADRITIGRHDHRIEIEQLRRERDDALTAARVAGAGVPDGWREIIQSAIDHLPYQHSLIPRLAQLLSAAPAAPQPSTTEESSAPEPAAPSEQQDADKLIAMGCAVDRSQAKRLLTQLRAAVNGSSASEPAQPTELERQMREALDGLLNIRSDSRGVAGYHLNGEIAEWGEFGEINAAEAALAAFNAAHPAYAEDAQ